jgi:uncharacterized protein GlcG (DUF336 family)
VLDRNGLTRAVLNTNAQRRTLDSSRGKATLVTLGPLFKKDLQRIGKHRLRPAAAALTSGPTCCPRAMIKSGDEVIGGIGVGGAPSGLVDEGCAKAGLEKIASSLK